MTKVGFSRMFSLRAAALIALGLVVAGCQTNQATGRQQLLFMSPQQEQRIGDEQHPLLVEAFGGEYDTGPLDAYVTRVGEKLDIYAETQGVEYTYTVLDSEIANAFALPGGYIHISRGLLAIMNNEAELASVLAHEIGHVTGRHSAERHGRSTVASVGVIAAAILTGSSQVAQGAQSVAQVALAGYSRSQESESDALGLRYMNAAGYDPDAMAEMLGQLGDNSALLARLAGREVSQQFDMLSTHPQTPQRIADASARAAAISPQGTYLGQDPFMAAIDGMIFGPGLDAGAVRGQRYGNLRDAVTWQAPGGFELSNPSSGSTLARGPNDTVVIYDAATHRESRSAQEFLTAFWARRYNLERLETVDVNGFVGATGVLRGIRTRAGQRDVRLMAIDLGGARYARFVLQTDPRYTSQMDGALQDLVYSFRRLNANERGLYQPRRIRVVTVRPGDSVSGLAGRMAVEKLPEDWFRTLNGLAPGEGLVAGQKVKIVVEG